MSIWQNTSLNDNNTNPDNPGHCGVPTIALVQWLDWKFTTYELIKLANNEYFAEYQFKW